MIAGLARAQPVEEIMEDYPSLNRRQIEEAIEYAKAYPKRGRPYPMQSLKRNLAELADAGAFDIDSDSDEVSPRLIP